MENKRVLIVDDNSSIHEDFKKILASEQTIQVDSAALFLGESDSANHEEPTFLLTSAYQGSEAIELVRDSIESNLPFAMAFVDMRMPPGMDGLETIERLWEIDPDLQVVICSAFSDHSWDDIRNRLGQTDQLLILKKPFERSEVGQTAVALTEKWRLTRQTRQVTNLNVAQLMSTEKTLNKRSQHLKLATDVAGLGYCQLSLATGAFEGSRVLHEILGIEPGSLNSLDGFLDTLVPSSREQITEKFRQTIENRTEFQCKSQFVNAKGQPGFLQIRFACEKGAGSENDSLFGVIQDITANESAIEAVRLASFSDSLTNLANRASLMQALNEFSWDSDSSCGLILVDVDHFKTVNLAWGHSVGDALLRGIGMRLQQAARQGDVVARIGADEFAIFQGNLDSTESSADTASRFHQAMQKPFMIQGQVIHGSASCGVANFPEQANSLDDLMVKADLALYQAKNDGTGSYQVYNDAIDKSIRLRRETEAELNLSLDKDQLELYYQPIVETGSGAVVAMEALIRWNHPTRGVISPFHFIPIAEETGMIIPIGRWVIHQACLDTMQLPEHVSVSVNVSAVQLLKADFYSTVVNSLEYTGLPANRLELEITETVFLNDTAQTLSTLRGLKELGVRIVMDDFGIGHSSLSYLRQFPFDKIKLDKSFLIESLENRESKAIISAVSALGNSLGMLTCAEGVETEEHLCVARAEGYTHCQGYYFGRPQPLEKVKKAFRTASFPIVASSIANSPPSNSPLS